MGSLKKFGRTDSVIASDSRSAGTGHAGTQGKRAPYVMTRRESFPAEAERHCVWKPIHDRGAHHLCRKLIRTQIRHSALQHGYTVRGTIPSVEISTHI